MPDQIDGAERLTRVFARLGNLEFILGRQLSIKNDLPRTADDLSILGKPFCQLAWVCRWIRNHRIELLIVLFPPPGKHVSFVRYSRLGRFRMFFAPNLHLFVSERLEILFNQRCFFRQTQMLGHPGIHHRSCGVVVVVRKLEQVAAHHILTLAQQPIDLLQFRIAVGQHVSRPVFGSRHALRFRSE